MTGRLDWKAALWAGLVAGLAFLAVEMLLVATLAGESPWGPPRMIAAILLGQDVLPPPAGFDPVVALAALAIHIGLSLILALPICWLIAQRRLGLWASAGAGGVYGLVVYLVNFYGFTALFPWFAEARTPITLVAHILFGLVLGWTYHALAVRHFARLAGRFG